MSNFIVPKYNLKVGNGSKLMLKMDGTYLGSDPFFFICIFFANFALLAAKVSSFKIPFSFISGDDGGVIGFSKKIHYIRNFL